MPSPTHLSASAAPRKSRDGKARGETGDGPSPAKAAERRAIPFSRIVVFFSLAAGGGAADLWTKHVMFAWRGLPPPWRSDAEPHAPWWIWENILGIETQLNQGALFGIGQGKVWLFAGLSFVAAGGILYWLFAAKAIRDLVLTIALGMVMAGIIGNLWDRLGLWANPTGEAIYAVRDWILIAYGGADLPLLGQRWPNFNIADSLLVCGAAMLIWHSFRAGREGASDPSPEKQIDT